MASVSSTASKRGGAVLRMHTTRDVQVRDARSRIDWGPASTTTALRRSVSSSASGPIPGSLQDLAVPNELRNKRWPRRLEGHPCIDEVAFYD